VPRATTEGNKNKKKRITACLSASPLNPQSLNPLKTLAHRGKEPCPIAISVGRTKGKKYRTQFAVAAGLSPLSRNFLALLLD